MNKLLGGLILVLMSSTALADWTNIGETSSFIVYVNYSSIHKFGTNFKMWHIKDYKDVQKKSYGTFLSAKELYEYDCEGEQVRILSSSLFSGNMGNGEVIYDSGKVETWFPVPPESNFEGLWKVACGKQ